MNFEQLMHEHDEIDAHTRALEACCTMDVPDIEAVIFARTQLRTVLEDHLAHEEGAIYPQLLAAGGHSADAVDDFNAAFAQLRADWGDYLSDWDAECLAADWATFQRETSALMSRVRDRTTRETALLYPIALRNGSIRLRAA